MFKLNFDVPSDPIVNVQTTENRGFTPDEVAERCVEKLISVSDEHPAIRDQAKAFQKHMEKVVAFYMREAIRSDRTTVYNALNDAGHPKLADAIRRL
jgi:macrodomain Ter protein organizer (MatP/YcbG family)